MLRSSDAGSRPRVGEPGGALLRWESLLLVARWRGTPTGLKEELARGETGGGYLTPQLFIDAVIMYADVQHLLFLIHFLSFEKSSPAFIRQIFIKLVSCTLCV